MKVIATGFALFVLYLGTFLNSAIAATSPASSGTADLYSESLARELGTAEVPKSFESQAKLPKPVAKQRVAAPMHAQLEPVTMDSVVLESMADLDRIERISRPIEDKPAKRSKKSVRR